MHSQLSLDAYGVTYAQFDGHRLQFESEAALQLEDGSHTPMPLLPLSLDGQRLQPRRAIARIGEHTRQVMRELGYSDAHIAELCAAGVLVVPNDC